MRKNHTRKNLNSRKNLEKIFSRGSKQVYCRGAKLRYIENELSENRMMICLVRKFGNAVQRNRAKRVFREIYRLNKNNLKPGYDLVFILLPGEYETKQREEQFEKLITRAQLYSAIE